MNSVLLCEPVSLYIFTKVQQECQFTEFHDTVNKQFSAVLTFPTHNNYSSTSDKQNKKVLDEEGKQQVWFVRSPVSLFPS